jgi:hypothetical protein
MKDMTDSMNSCCGEGGVKGYTDAGTPEPTGAAHKRRMEQGGLSSNEALKYFENPSNGVASRGFLRRNNYGERF